MISNEDYETYQKLEYQRLKKLKSELIFKMLFNESFQLSESDKITLSTLTSHGLITPPENMAILNANKEPFEGELDFEVEK